MKTDQIIERLSTQKPQLFQTNELTDKIMFALPPLKQHQLLYWVRSISASAAIFLVGLFTFQQNDISVIALPGNKTIAFHIEFNEASIYNNKDFNANPVNTYRNYLNSNILKNKRINSISNPLN